MIIVSSSIETEYQAQLMCKRMLLTEGTWQKTPAVRSRRRQRKCHKSCKSFRFSLR